MVRLEVSALVKASKATVFNIIKDPKALLKFVRGVETVEVLESGEETTLVRFKGRVGWLRLSSVHRAFFHPPHKLRFLQVEGDFKYLEGVYTLRGNQEGTRITYRIDFDLGLPLVGGLIGTLWVKRAMRAMVRELLQGIKREAEAISHPRSSGRGTAVTGSGGRGREG